MRYLFAVIFFNLFTVVFAQRFADQVPQIKRYSQKEICDSVNGITIYNKLIEPLGGDSIKYNKTGYNLQGWNEEYYNSGKPVHKGYYVDGRLKVFKNFYENGQVERSFVSPDPLHCNLDIYYENGFPKKKIAYYDGKPQKLYEYYENGLPKTALENEKEMKYVTLKKSWYSSGQMESYLELRDKKVMLFAQKKFYENGQLKEEGLLKLSKDGKDYLKDGEWTFYDESGKNKKVEKFKVQ